MSRYFLVGRFLPSHGQSFGRVRHPVREDGALTPERLAVRFDERARRHHTRRGEYVRTLQGATVVALLVVIGVFRADFRAEGVVDLRMEDQELVAMEEILQTVQIERPPPPPRPPIPVEVPDDAFLDDVDLDLDATLDVEVALVDLPPPPPEPDPVPEPEEPEVFFVVEQMPDMIGGMAALVADLDYPEVARRAGIDGMVVVQIVIPPSGIPQNPQVLKSVGDVLDAAAVEAVMKQTFTPGRQRGRPVTVAMNIPVVFRLS